jgi:hypothetical protein
MEEKNLPRPKVFLPDLVTVVASPAIRMILDFFKNVFAIAQLSEHQGIFFEKKRCTVR